MIVLLNQEIIDVGDPAETLTQYGVADLRMPTIAKVVALGQDAAYAAKGLENAHRDIRRTLAALLASSGEVNCALFLAPAAARSPREVAVRVGYAPILTLAYLLSAQQAGKLTPALINKHVWQLASGDAAA